MRERGAIAWKLLVAVVATAGGVWAATQLSSQAPRNEAVPDVAGETAPGRIKPAGQSPGAGSPSAPAAPQNDPFAGVDVASNSVLRHIAGIEEKARAKLGATKRNAPAAGPSDSASSQRANTPAPAPARQEGSARPAPAPSSAAPTTSSPAEAIRPTATTTVPAQVVAASPPTQVETPPAAPLKSPTVAPAAAAPAAAERTPLAAARIEPAPPQVMPSLRIVNRTVPEFPGEAIRAGVRTGRVVARLTIDAEGRVTATQLLSATPTGFFERESRRALSTWRYEPTGREMTTDVELVFTRE